MLIRAKDILLIPNLLSVARIALIFLPAYLIAEQNPGNRPYILLLIAIGIVSDILDGVLARRLNQISDLGKILDPVADKVCTGVLVIALYLYSDFPLWAVLVILVRDFSLLIGALFLVRKRSEITTSNMVGKLAALSWGIVILVFVLDWDILKTPMLVIAAAMVAVSATSYTKRYLRKLRESQNTPKP